MKKTTIFADEALIREFKELSKEENRSVTQMVREAMEQYVRQRHQIRRRKSFPSSASAQAGGATC